jgi:potassium channel subfamily K
LTATAAGPLRITDPTSKYVFSQAFYYAIISAGLYFVVASLMVVTVYGAHTGHYDKDFKLTISQRTLMLQTISFMVYLLSGAAVYSRIEGWNYLDAVYFADFTLLTVGIGDFSPSTNTGRGLLFPFAIGGIIILGLVIGSIRSLVLERGKVKMEARMVEKERERIINHLQKNKPDVLLPSEENERQHREEEFHIMRKIEKRANKRRQWMSLIISGTTWLVLWFAGAAIFQVSEFDQAWSYFDSLYFSYTSLLTIGYGDISPESNSGKPFFVFWSLLAIPSLTVLISNMGDTIVKGIRDLTLWIGELTVLPGEKGVRAGLKNAVHQFTKGKFFDDEIKEQPPGFLGQGPKQENANESDIGNDMNKNDPESAAQRVEGERAKAETEAAKKRGRYGDKLPKNRKHYHCILIEEIGNVMNHLNSSPPRKYDFDEWAWYLKLIGEDESSPVTHRAAPRNLKQGEHGLTIETTTGEKNKGNKTFEWSWIGNRSPLMGNKEEAKWVLERLTKTLRRELEDIRREESEGTGDWAKGGKMREGIMNNRE